MFPGRIIGALTVLLATGAITTVPARAEPPPLFGFLFGQPHQPAQSFTPPVDPAPPAAAIETDNARHAPHIKDDNARLPPRLQRQVVDYPTRQAPGTIIVDTPHTYLYYVLGGGKAIRYGIGVGRKGFTWSGVKSVVRKAEWPDWYPPKEMIARQPNLPRMVSGGPGNPLGARALYIGGTEYRIHGTNEPDSIGKHVSSGCIRLTNDNIVDLYNRVRIGAKVIVLPQMARPTRAAENAPKKALKKASVTTRKNRPHGWRAKVEAAIAASREAEAEQPAQTSWDALHPNGHY